MNTLEWKTTGLGLLSIACGVFLLFIFRKKQLGLLDPLSVYLATRAAPALATIILMFSSESIFSYFYLVTVGSALVFFLTLYSTSPSVAQTEVLINRLGINDLFRVAIFLSVVKIFIFITASGSLPAFGDAGSDSYISFASDNKLGSSFLLAIGSSELVLLSFLLGVSTGRSRFIIFVALLLSILMSLVSGKKSSLLGVFYALALGEYLRLRFTNCTKRYFTNLKFFIIFLSASTFWAGYIFNKTSGDLGLSEANLITSLIDIVFFQWAYPIYLFSSNELSGFFDSYDVNRLIYFFHTALSPLGFPAFTASIGPAIHEYQTGTLTGNGVNPTYLIEGYVLFGDLLPLYAFLVALIIGKIRERIDRFRKSRNKILIYALLLPPLYIIPVDSLLFMKIIIALILLSPVLLLALRLRGK